ncbi:hypothetical protein PTSG_06561 [Salpingoeca rosetta]|uniref:Acid ceramidase N-terminal domain-containing protein n=1 Tax=Salpingoeca rosetta (strain ATCC 50818 / BSB-021) TaxID=946362 RepID=F2UG59_SALR5|nr:uncharacterized protein PTSG_06561 [Salpingoeca rosetta]EGD75487.1 hypothetical protein PTSG_06561 [Salpingoeca rosetta]|eukprot:XP_004991944.1 hypothetical protein PTSG_06561 [Salpingoeca rosetta]
MAGIRVVVGAVVLLSMLLGLSHAACPGSPNTLPIFDDEPKHVRSVENGKLFSIDHGNGKSMRILHVYGTPYQMGKAQGEIFTKEIYDMITAFSGYIDSQIEPYIKWLPKEIQEIILKDGPQAALQFEVDLTRKYIPQHFFDELKGIADGMNGTMSYDEILQFHLFPELIKASCSMFGAWGPALANTSDTLNQLRALDWGIDNPLINYSVVVVYHPNDGNGHAFASLTWTGFIGSITAYGGHTAVSEKVWLSYNETYARAGIPFHFLMRDIAQYDRTLSDALNRVYNNRRTCSIHLGVGSRHDQQFRAVEYGHEEVLVYDDLNYPTYLPAHPQMDGLVFINKHVQPSHDTCMGSLMQKHYGNLTAETTIRNVLGNTQSGDMHAAVYNFEKNHMYVSVAGPKVTSSGDVESTVTPAYARPWFKLDMTKLFAQQQ